MRRGGAKGEMRGDKIAVAVTATCAGRGVRF